MKKKLCFITGSRADYGPIRYFLNQLKKNNNFKVQIIVTGSHLSNKFGSSVKEIIKDGFKINKKININLSGKSASDIAKATGRLIQFLPLKIKKLNPDAIILFGDRYETFAAAYSAFILRKPIVHICGGDITVGSLDNTMRHSITKMSNLHFVTNKASRKVVIRLGENPKSVFNTGSLGTEAISKIKLLTKEDLEKKYKINLSSKNLLITYHADGSLKNSYTKDLSNIFSALEKFPKILKIFTASNADENGEKANFLIKNFIKKRKNNSIFLPSMGNVNYLSILKYVDAVIGNSSSGIYEVPSFRKPTVNLGNRQEGRLMAKSVIHSKINKKFIIQAINKVYSKKFRKKLKKIKNPYSGKNASNNMIKILLKYDFSKFKKNI
jgi:UDP-hydrolysing UDP-N-acetyl-D-glucosamine 2-epimerase